MTLKIHFLLSVSLLVFTTTAAMAQHPPCNPHHPPDLPVVAPPSSFLAPVIPTAPPVMPKAPTSSIEGITNEYSDILLSLAQQINTLKSDVDLLEHEEKKYAKNGFIHGDGSLEEAETFLNIHIRNLAQSQERLALWNERLAEYLELKAENKFIQDWQIETAYYMLAYYSDITAYHEEEIAFWTAETGSRDYKMAAIQKELSEKRAALTQTEVELEKTQQERAEKLKDHYSEYADYVRAYEEHMQSQQQDTVSAGDLGVDDFFGGVKTTKSSETANITPDKSLQELREDSMRDAFSEMRSLEFQTGFLQTVNVGGQVVQTVIGVIPGMTTVDVGLSSARGFTEALGEEIAKGTSWGDALKIATVNAGMKGAISVAGNVLTGGADVLSNRVAVLTEVGFSKLTTKQVAELGAKGISFVVVKSGQVMGQELTDELARKPAMKVVADYIKDDSNPTKSPASGSLGGYSMSTATQPLVSY